MLASLLEGCCVIKKYPTFRYEVPMPEANPVYATCPNLREKECVTILTTDFNIYLDQLAMFCEMAGNDPEFCDIRGL